MTLDSHNPYYVNPFTRGTPTPAGLRFSSNVVGGIEIAVFVAKAVPAASDFDRNPSLQGSGFRKTGAGFSPARAVASVAAVVLVARRRSW